MTMDTEALDPYATHLPMLASLFRLTEVATVVEFGSGLHSTPFLLRHADHVVSLEMEKRQWFRRLSEIHRNEIRSGKLDLRLALGPDAWREHQLPGRIDLAFVDGHWAVRPECVNAMLARQVPVVATHDLEYPEYHWERLVIPDGYVRLSFEMHHRGRRVESSAWVRKAIF